MVIDNKINNTISSTIVDEMVELYTTTKQRYFGIAYTINNKYGTNYNSLDIRKFLKDKKLPFKPFIKLTALEELELVRRYKEDNIRAEIVGIDFGIGKNESNTIINKHNAMRAVGENRIYPKELFALIREKYLNGDKVADIGIALNLKTKTVTHLLNGMDIVRRTAQKHTIDDDFFEVIDTQEKAYILGLLYADGCNYRNKRNIAVALQLQERDKDILFKIKDIMKYTGDIYFAKKRFTHHQNSYVLKTFSKKISSDLLKHGMTPRKSFTKTFPILEDHLVRHFIRGYFDGNGSINLRASTNLPTTSFTSSRPMINALVDIFKRELDITCSVFNKHNINGYIDTLFIYGHEYNMRLRDYLYKDSTIEIERKKEKFYLIGVTNHGIKRKSKLRIKMEEMDLDSLLGEQPIVPPSYGKEESEKPKSNYSSGNNYNNNNGGYNKNKGNFKKGNGVNMYEVEFIKAKDIDTDAFNKVGRSFAVHAFKPTDDDKKKILIIAKKLIKDGFTYRHDGPADDEVSNLILEIEDATIESYLPYKKFNENIEKPIIVNYFELPYQYAATLYGQRYNDMKPGGRAVFASKVQALLGKECTNPVDFLICYNPTGDEMQPAYEKGKKIDYENLGSLGFYLKIAEKAGIGVYNIKNESSLKNLIELLK